MAIGTSLRLAPHSPAISPQNWDNSISPAFAAYCPVIDPPASATVTWMDGSGDQGTVLVGGVVSSTNDATVTLHVVSSSSGAVPLPSPEITIRDHGVLWLDGGSLQDSILNPKCLLTIESGGKLRWTRGTITNAIIEVRPHPHPVTPTQVAAGAILEIEGDSGSRVLDGAYELATHGTLLFSGDGSLQLLNGASISVKSGGVFRASPLSLASLVDGGSAASPSLVIENGGVLERSSQPSATFEVHVASRMMNGSVVQVTSGTLALVGASVNAGRWEATGSGVFAARGASEHIQGTAVLSNVRFESSTVSIVNNTLFSSVTLSGAVVDVASQLSIDGACVLSGGQLSGDGALVVVDGGALTWTGGLLAGSGLFTVELGGMFVIDAQLTLSRALDNVGTLHINQVFSIGSGLTLHNTGLVVYQAPSGSTFPSSGILLNEGLVQFAADVTLDTLVHSSLAAAPAPVACTLSSVPVSESVLAATSGATATLNSLGDVTGSIEADTDSALVLALTSWNSPDVVIKSGGRITFAGATPLFINGGGVCIEDTGVFALVGDNTTIDGISWTVGSGAAIALGSSDATVSLRTGSISILPGAVVDVVGGLVVLGNGFTVVGWGALRLSGGILVPESTSIINCQISLQGGTLAPPMSSLALLSLSWTAGTIDSAALNLTVHHLVLPSTSTARTLATGIQIHLVNTSTWTADDLTLAAGSSLILEPNSRLAFDSQVARLLGDGQLLFQGGVLAADGGQGHILASTMLLINPSATGEAPLIATAGMLSLDGSAGGKLNSNAWAHGAGGTVVIGGNSAVWDAGTNTYFNATVANGRVAFGSATVMLANSLIYALNDGTIELGGVLHKPNVHVLDGGMLAQSSSNDVSVVGGRFTAHAGSGGSISGGGVLTLDGNTTLLVEASGAIAFEPLEGGVVRFPSCHITSDGELVLGGQGVVEVTGDLGVISGTGEIVLSGTGTRWMLDARDAIVLPLVRVDGSATLSSSGTLLAAQGVVCQQGALTINANAILRPANNTNINVMADCSLQGDGRIELNDGVTAQVQADGRLGGQVLLLPGSEVSSTGTLGTVLMEGGEIHGAGPMFFDGIVWHKGSLNFSTESSTPITIDIGALILEGAEPKRIVDAIVTVVGPSEHRGGASLSLEGSARFAIGSSGVFSILSTVNPVLAMWDHLQNGTNTTAVPGPSLDVAGQLVCGASCATAIRLAVRAVAPGGQVLVAGSGVLELPDGMEALGGGQLTIDQGATATLGPNGLTLINGGILSSSGGGMLHGMVSGRGIVSSVSAVLVPKGTLEIDGSLEMMTGTTHVKVAASSVLRISGAWMQGPSSVLTIGLEDSDSGQVVAGGNAHLNGAIIGDASSFRPKNGAKLSVVESAARVDKFTSEDFEEAEPVVVVVEYSKQGADLIVSVCPSDCSGNGECLEGGSCSCSVGWMGESCSISVWVIVGVSCGVLLVVIVIVAIVIWRTRKPSSGKVAPVENELGVIPPTPKGVPQALAPRTPSTPSGLPNGNAVPSLPGIPALGNQTIVVQHVADKPEVVEMDEDGLGGDNMSEGSQGDVDEDILRELEERYGPLGDEEKAAIRSAGCGAPRAAVWAAGDAGASPGRQAGHIVEVAEERRPAKSKSLL